MIKIIFVINSLASGGAERVMSVLANEFVDIGYDVSIISKAHYPPFYKLKEKIRVIFPQNKINYKNKISTLWGRLNVYRNIYNILKQEKPDLVIPFSTTTNGTVILICKILRLKVIACEHNNYKLNINSFPTWFIKRWIYPKANFLTVLTKRDKDQFYGHFMKNVKVMPNPLPIEPIDNQNNSQREKTILAIGNLSRWEQKGFDNLFRIYSQIVPKHPEWKLKIAGGGNPDVIHSLVKKYNISEKVELLGEVKNIQEIMQKSSIFVLPSRWEGLPMVLIEAMSQGMACIAYDCFTGPGDIITNNVDGILIEDQNEKEFIQKISLLIENDSLRKELGENAVKTSKNFLPDKIVAQWQKLIHETIHE